LFHLPETKTKGPDVEQAEGSAPPGWWMSQSVVVPSFGLLCAGTLFAVYDVVWPQYLTARHIGTLVIGLSISAFALPVLLFARRAGRLGDRADRRLLVSGAFLIVATTASLYPLLRSLPVIIGVGMVEAMGFMIVEPALFAVLSEATAPEVRGKAMGIGGFFQFGGAAVGAAVLGSLYGVSEGLPFWSGAAVCAAAALVCGLWLPVKRLRHTASLGVPQIQPLDAESKG
jgi:MFS family permease